MDEVAIHPYIVFSRVVAEIEFKSLKIDEKGF
jgi:hypothetical protein